MSLEMDPTAYQASDGEQEHGQKESTSQLMGFSPQVFDELESSAAKQRVSQRQIESTHAC